MGNINKLVVENYEQGVNILDKKFNGSYEIKEVATKRKWVIAGPKRCEISYVGKDMPIIKEVVQPPVVANIAPKVLEDGLTQVEKDLMDEVMTLKDLMGNLMEQVSVSIERSKISGNSLISGIEEVLVGNGVAPEIAEELIKKAVNSLHPKYRENKNHIITGLRKVLVGMINVAPGYDADELSKVVFVGPTGVGKTTTLAKTATIFQEKNKKVALITLDTYKLGAIDQIEEYAELLEVPADACSTEDELHTSMIRFMDKDCIFVDTMGHNPKDVKANTLLKKMIDLFDPNEVTLVMSANMKTKDLYDCIEQFKYLDFGTIIMTKLDETNSLGEIINVAYKYPKYKMVYFTTGQGVPEDIEIAKAEKLIKSVISEE